MVLSKLHGLFKSAYEPKNLLKTNVVASGILLLIGDTIQQSIELYRGVHEKGEIKMVTNNNITTMTTFPLIQTHLNDFFVLLSDNHDDILCCSMLVQCLDTIIT